MESNSIKSETSSMPTKRYKCRFCEYRSNRKYDVEIHHMEKICINQQKEEILKRLRIKCNMQKKAAQAHMDEQDIELTKALRNHRERYNE